MNSVTVSSKDTDKVLAALEKENILGGQKLDDHPDPLVLYRNEYKRRYGSAGSYREGGVTHAVI